MAERPGWAWFSPRDAPWWSAAAVHHALLTERITPAHVLPRLSAGEVTFDDEWVDRFEDPWHAMVDDDPHVESVPVATSWRWVRLLADELDGDRATTLRDVADPAVQNDLRERSERLGQLQPFVTSATVDDWPPGGWQARTASWFLNGGLHTPSTLVDLVELQGQVVDQLLPGAEVFGVFVDSDEEGQSSTVVAALRVGDDDPSSSVSRRAALDRLRRWAAGEVLEGMGDVPPAVEGYSNKTLVYTRLSGNLQWHMET